MKNIILCLDGTTNNVGDFTLYHQHMIPGKDSLPANDSKIRPSNVLKIARNIEHQDADNNKQIVYYQPGVASSTRYQGKANTMLYYSDKLWGYLGAGFQANVEEACTFLILNYEEGDQVFISGFSRGAATARALVKFFEWMGGMLSASDHYWLPLFIREFIARKGQSNFFEFCQKLDSHTFIKKRLKDKISSVQIQIELKSLQQPSSAQELKCLNKPIDSSFSFASLAVFDTVTSLFSVFDFLVNGDLPRNCQHLMQALAIDEVRYDFQPEIWQSDNSPQMQQRWFCGAHSDVGGAANTPSEGLSNIALRWITDAWEDKGINFHPNLKRFYRRFPYEALHQPHLTSTFKVIGVLRRNKIRKIACGDISAYVIERMLSHASYRPINVIDLLKDIKADTDNLIELYHSQSVTIKNELEKRAGIAALLEELRIFNA
jgi:hypothetical protein